jgi:diguanylate cyclase (GGDEF)-like protein
MQIAAERETKFQRHRLRMTLISVGNYSLTTIIFALFAWTGELAWSIVWQFFLAGVGSSGFFSLMIVRRWNLRLKDPGMLVPQLITAVLVQLAFLVLAPKLWMLLLVALLVTYNFAMMSFSRRQLTMSWLAMSAASAVALFAARGRFEPFATTHTSIAILWLFVFLCFRQLTDIGMQFHKLRTQLTEKNKQLAESFDRIHELASHDELTGVLNRRSLIQLLADERERAKRTGLPFCAALLDIDHFKSVNDRFGHLMGDLVLKEFCTVAMAGIRTTDRFARYGGEEFFLLLAPATTAEVAAVATERVRLAVEAHDWGRLAPGLKMTVSAGVAEFEMNESIEQMIGRVDVALYAAKRGGRNRTNLAGSPDQV